MNSELTSHQHRGHTETGPRLSDRPEQRRPAFMYERRHIKRLFTIYANREASNQAALQRSLAQPDLSHR